MNENDLNAASEFLSAALTSVAMNEHGRCGCGVEQPNDVNWAQYEMEVEDVHTGEVGTVCYLVCPECEARLDAQTGNPNIEPKANR